MQRLLTGEVRLIESKGNTQYSAQRKAPTDWVVREFGDFVERDTRRFDPKKSDNVLPCIELEHISQGTGQILGSTTTETQLSIKNCFNAGQILFGKLRPYLEKYAQPDFDGVCSSEIWVLSGKRETCLNDFLYYLVQSRRFVNVANVSSGSKMPRADWGYVSEYTFSIPNLEEQQHIVDTLRDHDKLSNLLERYLDELREQKKGLMQRLLTGQVRVKVEE